jgi:glutamyl-tRNA(Gln) amidotransferase subunit E
VCCPAPTRCNPDTDTAPIPLADAYIEELRQRIPDEVHNRILQMAEWGIPEDTYTFILSKTSIP